MLSAVHGDLQVTEKALDEGTDPWGVKVERVEMKDIRLPHSMMRSMAVEAEAAREARAKVVAAEGEKRASKYVRGAHTDSKRVRVQCSHYGRRRTDEEPHGRTVTISADVEINRV